MGDVGAFEANDKFGQLLDLVAHGEEVMITRHGRAVAHLIPTRPSSDRGAARAAMQRMRAGEAARARPFRLVRVGVLPEPGPPVSLALDSSATLAWIYGDEATAPIRGVWERIADTGAAVPALWRLDVANSLTVAVRRNRIDTEFRQLALADPAEDSICLGVVVACERVVDWLGLY